MQVRKTFGLVRESGADSPSVTARRAGDGDTHGSGVRSVRRRAPSPLVRAGAESRRGGIVLVSHSAKLAEGVAELAAGDGWSRGAAGTGGRPRGGRARHGCHASARRDRPRVERRRRARADGLGSAVLSAETALDFVPEERRGSVLLCGRRSSKVRSRRPWRIGASLEGVAAEPVAASRRKLRTWASRIPRRNRRRRWRAVTGGRRGSGSNAGAARPACGPLRAGRGRLRRPGRGRERDYRRRSTSRPGA